MDRDPKPPPFEMPDGAGRLYYDMLIGRAAPIALSVQYKSQCWMVMYEMSRDGWVAR